MPASFPKFIFFTALMTGFLASNKPLWAIVPGIIALITGVISEFDIDENNKKESK